MADKPSVLETDIDFRRFEFAQDLVDPLSMAERAYELWKRWADFHLYVISPHFQRIFPPKIIHPEQLEDGSLEFVYDIHDSGSILTTSKSANMFSSGVSMCQLFFTIEKMIALLVERLQEEGVSMEAEVQVAFGGHIIAQRKAFESVINLLYNVVVTNFEPGEWGDHYLECVKRLADKGYGYPSETPRTYYKQIKGGKRPGI